MGLTIDAHSDLLNDILARRQVGEKEVLKNRWLPGMIQGGIDLRVAAVYIGNEYLPEGGLRRALDMVAALLEELETTDKAVLVRSGRELDQALEKGRIGFALGLEGAEPLGSDPALLRIFHRLGLRVLGLTHARRNALAEGAPFFPVRAGREGGLSHVGVSLVELAQELNILIDLSHLNEPGFWDVLEMARPPLIASHSNARVVHDHPRNLTDEQIEALARGGGVIGVNVDRFIAGGDDLDLVFRHLDHLIRVGGEEHVGLGPDFCDYLLDLLSPLERAQVPEGGGLPVKGLEGDPQIPLLAQGLTDRGYKPRVVELVMGRNFERVMKEVWGD